MMNNEKALHYLLLRNIYACRHLADKQKCEELSRTLAVHQIDKRVFSIKWESGGEVFSSEVPYDRFLFFAPSNRNAVQSLQGDVKTNNTAARKIVYELLNINSLEKIKPSRKRHVPFVSLFGSSVLIIALLLLWRIPEIMALSFSVCACLQNFFHKDVYCLLCY